MPGCLPVKKGCHGGKYEDDQGQKRNSGCSVFQRELNDMQRLMIACSLIDAESEDAGQNGDFLKLKNRLELLESRLQQIEPEHSDRVSILERKVEELLKWKNRREPIEANTGGESMTLGKIGAMEAKTDELNKWKDEVTAKYDAGSDKFTGEESLVEMKKQVVYLLDTLEKLDTRVEKDIQLLNESRDEVLAMAENLKKEVKENPAMSELLTWKEDMQKWRDTNVEVELKSQRDLIGRFKDDSLMLTQMRDEHQEWKKDVLPKLHQHESKMTDLERGFDDLLSWTQTFVKWKDEELEKITVEHDNKLKNMEIVMGESRNRHHQMEEKVNLIENKIGDIERSITDTDGWKSIFYNTVDEISETMKNQNTDLTNATYDISVLQEWKNDIGGWRSDVDVKISSEILPWKQDMTTWKHDIVSTQLADFSKSISALEQTMSSVILPWKSDMMVWRNDHVSRELTDISRRLPDVERKMTSNILPWKDEISEWRRHSVTPQLSDFSGRIPVLESKMSSEVLPWKNEITEWKNDNVTPKLSDFSGRIPALESKMSSEVLPWKDEITEWKNESVTPQLSDFSGRIPALESKMSSEVLPWKDEITKWKNESVTPQLSDFSSRIPALESKMSAEVLPWKVDMTAWRTGTIDKSWEDLLERTTRLERHVRWLEISGGDTNFMMYLMIVIIVAIVGLLVLIIHRTKLQTSTASMGSKPSPASVLDSLKVLATEDSICIISFYNNTQDHHRQLTKSIVNSNKALKQLPIHPYLVDSHDKILNMPPSKIFLVFVDHNERNIILEDPDQELGDLRRTTVQGAIKMGANLFVIYTYDVESEKLKGEELYNERLTSVKRHKVLVPLSEQKRVLSVYKDFNAYQIKHLQKILQDIVDKKNK